MHPLLGMAAQAGINYGTGLLNDARQQDQTRALNAIEEERQRRMTEYNMRKQMEMWEKTGYGPTVDQMKRAGLNPALMYKGTGAGGSTQIAASSMQNAGGAPNAPMGVVSVAEAAQLSLLNAQKENIEADTKNKLATATKTSGVDTQVAENQLQLIAAQTENEVVKKEINEQIKEQQFVETHIKTMTMNQVVSQSIQQTASMWETLQSQIMQNRITKETAEDQIEIVKQQKLMLIMQKQAVEMGIKVDKAQMQKMAAEIAQGWQGLSLEEKRMKVEGVMKQIGMANNGLLMNFRAGDIGGQSATKQIDEILNIGKEDFKK